MVRVVDPSPDPEVIKKISCRQCGVRLEYTPSSVKRYSGKDYGGGPDGKEWIDCPNCSSEVITNSW